MNSVASLLHFAPVIPTPCGWCTSLPTGLGIPTRLTITALNLSFRVNASSTIQCGAGISACSPSPTTSVLGLGPDLPWVDEPSPGNLGHKTPVFLAQVSLLIPAFSLPCSPPLLPLWLPPACYAPLPMSFDIPLLRCRVLAPLHFRRWITRPVSYYALFKCVAASEPTSWLSRQSDILSHLTHTLGP